MPRTDNNKVLSIGAKQSIPFNFATIRAGCATHIVSSQKLTMKYQVGNRLGGREIIQASGLRGFVLPLLAEFQRFNDSTTGKTATGTLWINNVCDTAFYFKCTIGSGTCIPLQ